MTADIIDYSAQLGQIIDSLHGLTEYMQSYSVMLTVMFGLMIGLLCILVIRR